jgi:hypothetical protein
MKLLQGVVEPIADRAHERLDAGIGQISYQAPPELERRTSMRQYVHKGRLSMEERHYVLDVWPLATKDPASGGIGAGC